MLLLLSTVALAFTDNLGGDDVANDDGDMLKLVALGVGQAAFVDEVGFAVSGRGVDSEVVIVLYVEAGGTYTLVGQATASVPPDGQLGWARVSDVGWLLEPGQTYAIGAYVGEGWTYYYDEGGSRDPWFAEVLAGYRVDDREAIPGSFRGEPEEYFYWIQIQSRDADADGDGVAGAEFGGADCDDADPSVTEPTDEVPYDGIDQDCDGVDMNDIDHDGVVAAEAGGPDCDDTTGAVSPENEEVCGDGLDNDCAGGDLACDDEEEPRPSKEGFGNPVDVTPEGCGCDSGSGTAGLGAALALVAAAGIRRRK